MAFRGRARSRPARGKCRKALRKPAKPHNTIPNDRTQHQTTTRQTRRRAFHSHLGRSRWPRPQSRARRSFNASVGTGLPSHLHRSSNDCPAFCEFALDSCLNTLPSSESSSIYCRMLLFNMMASSFLTNHYLLSRYLKNTLPPESGCMWFLLWRFRVTHARFSG